MLCYPKTKILFCIIIIVFCLMYKKVLSKKNSISYRLPDGYHYTKSSLYKRPNRLQCYNPQATMCEPPFENLSAHKIIQAKVESPVNKTFLEGLKLEFSYYLAKYHYKYSEKNENSAKLKKVRKSFDSRNDGDSHCSLLSSIFHNKHKIRTINGKSKTYVDTGSESSQNNYHHQSNARFEVIFEPSNINSNDSSNIHNYFTYNNFTNVNLTISFGKKFELSKISLDVCELPDKVHISFYKGYSKKRNYTPLQHFSDDCNLIMSKKPFSMHSLNALKVNCTLLSRHIKCHKKKNKKLPKTKNHYKNRYENNQLPNEKHLFKGFKPQETNSTSAANAFHNNYKVFKRKNIDFNKCADVDITMNKGKGCLYKCCTLQKSKKKFCRKICYKRNISKNKAQNYHNTTLLKPYKKLFKRKIWNSKILLPNHHASQNAVIPKKGRARSKTSNICRNGVLSYEFFKENNLDIAKNPLKRDFVTASEVLVVIYFPENLDKLQEDISTKKIFTKSKLFKSDFVTHKNELFPTNYLDEINILSVAGIRVEGKCKCNGHANKCIFNNFGKLVCQCQHNTYGSDCEKCKPFYQNQPWKRATEAVPAICKVCDCNRHSRKCRFNRELYEMSSKKGGAVCIGCKHNTAGRHCHYCKTGYRRHPSKPIYHRSACIKCNCHILGSMGSWCDPRTGQCVCKEGVGGLKCHTCLSGYLQDRSPNHPCVKKESSDQLDEPKGDQHRKRNTLKSFDLISCVDCFQRNRLKLDIFCRSKYVLIATIEKVVLKDNWAWVGVFIEHSYKHKEGKIQQRRTEFFLPRKHFDCMCPTNFELNQTYIILAKADKIFLKDEFKDIVRDERIDDFKNSVDATNSNIITQDIIPLDNNSTYLMVSNKNNFSYLTSPLEPFILDNYDTAIKWSDNMKPILIRMVRNQQRGLCTSFV